VTGRFQAVDPPKLSRRRLTRAALAAVAVEDDDVELGVVGLLHLVGVGGVAPVDELEARAWRPRSVSRRRPRPLCASWA
jgi:hypothetical protein